MRQKSFGLEWLDRSNHKQRHWAHQYLQREERISQESTSSTHEELLRAGEGLERSRVGRATIQRMRNAWRQMEYRAPDNGRKAYTFKLKVETKKELAWLARKNKTNETDLLSKLIADGSNAHAALRTEFKTRLSELKEEAKTQRETSKIIMDLLVASVALLCQSDVLLQDASLSTEAISEDQHRRIEKLRKQTMVDAKADIAAMVATTDKIKLHYPGRLYRAVQEKRYIRTSASKGQEDKADRTQKRQASSTSREPVTRPTDKAQASSRAKTDRPPQGTQTTTRPPPRNRSIWLLAQTELGPHA